MPGILVVVLAGLAIPAFSQVPLASPDQFRSDSGVTFEISAPGVMSNDTPAGGTCLLVEPPKFASSFNLISDGGFAYTPKAGFSGEDIFKYRVVNDIGKSSTVGVRLTVRPLLESIAPSRTSIVGGFEESLLVSLNAPALSGGATVNFSTSQGNVLLPPTSVFIGEGQRSRKVSLKSNSVTERTEVSLTGSYRSTSKSVPMVVRVGGLKRVKMTPSSFIGGRALVGSVELTGRAPVGGRAITLASESGALQVPYSVLVPEGETVGVFTATSSAVLSEVTTRVKAKLGCLSRSSGVTLAPNATTPPAVKENVRVLPNDGSVTITPGPEPGQLTLEGAVPNIAPGDVLVAEQGEGLLRQATVVKPTRGSIVVDTTQATIEDVFNEATIRITKTLGQSDLESFVPDVPGLYIEDRPLEVNAPITFPLRLAGVQLAGSLFADISVDVAVTLNADADVGLTGIRYLKFAPTAIMKGSVRVRGGGSISGNRRLGVFYFKPTAFNVGFVPVVIVPELSLYMNGGLQLSASLDATVTPTVSATFGVEVANNTPAIVKDFGISSGFSPSINATISGSANFTPLRAEFRYKLYGIDGFYANMNCPRIEAGFVAKTNPLGVDVNASLVVDGEAGIRFTVLGRKLIDKEFAKFEIYRSAFYRHFFLLDQPILHVSEQSSRFKWFGPNYVPYLNSATTSPGDGGSLGDGGHIYYTYHSPTTVVNKGQWWPKFVESGNYEIYVYVPRWYADTADARYYIHAADKTYLKSISQKAYSDVWVSLGVYKFNAGETGYLELADLTSDPPFESPSGRKRRWIAYDTAKWVKR